MNEITVGEHDYVVGKLDAFAQLHVSRRIAPVIPTLAPLISEAIKGGIQEIAHKIKSNLEALEAVEDAGETGLSEAGKAAQKLDGINLDDLTGFASSAIPFAEALSGLSDDNVNYIVKACLSVVKRRNGNNLAVVAKNDVIMFDDLEMTDMLPLVIFVLRTSLGNFIRGLLTSPAEEVS